MNPLGRIRPNIHSKALAWVVLTAVIVLAGRLGAEKGKGADQPPGVPVFDLHCDTLYQSLKDKKLDLGANDGQVDLKKMRKGGYVAQVFAMWPPTGKGWKTVEKMIGTFWKWKKKHAGDFVLATSGSHILKAAMAGKISGVLGIEGLAALEGDLSKVKELHDSGVRVLGLTWFNSNEFAGTSNSKDKKGNFGLTEKGRKVVALANELGMVIDVSHASDQTVLDVAEISTRPFMASHSCARGLNDIERNLSDALMKTIASKGGVIGINFHRGFLSEKPRDQVKLKDVADQIVYISKVAGIDAVALGSDFDGASPPADLSGAHKMQDLALHLSKRGFSDEDIGKVMYRNALRLFTKVTEGGDIENMISHTHPLAALW